MLPLALRAAHRSAEWEKWPSVLKESLERDTRRQIAEKLLKREETRRVLDALAEQGVQCVLMKGMPLSYLIYDEPHLRPFEDVDLLIREGDRGSVERVLTDLGYDMPAALCGGHSSHQRSFYRTDTFGVRHIFDVHWKISNPHVFSELISFDEALTNALPVTALGPHARALALPGSMLLAAVHRVAHHAGDERLIWLYDIHLLVSRLTDEEWVHVREMAARRKMKAVLQDALETASARLGTRFPRETGAAAAAPELSEAYLKKGPKRLRDLIMNLRTLPGARRKAGYLYEIAFPPSHYMRSKYRIRSSFFLPFLYIYRALTGFVKLFTSSR